MRVFSSLCAVLLAGSVVADPMPPSVSDLSCERQRGAVETGALRPRLGWVLDAGQQSAFQVVVEGVWDSGRVVSPDSVDVAYGGPPLDPRRTVRWKVRVWDGAGRVSDWSAPAVWTQGITRNEDWPAAWIAARSVPMRAPTGQVYRPAASGAGTFVPDGVPEAPASRRESVLMRRDFVLPSVPVRATARVAALGFADVHVNGRRSGDRAMAPGLTDYTRRVHYDAHDVTGLLRAGTNVVALELGNGYFASPGRGWGKWYGVGREPAVSLELDWELADGTRGRTVTDDSWTWSTGDITFNDFFTGETQDLRRTRPGWNAPGFDAADWSPVVRVDAPPGRLLPNPGPPVRVCREVKPLRREGARHVFDAMYSGRPRLRVRGAPGQVVIVGGSKESARYEFTLRGGGAEVLEPRFVVQTIGPVVTVDGIDPAQVDEVTIQRVHADLRVTGEFSCSDPFLNGVHDAFVRTHLNYTYDFPMDPTREKSGWTQDVQTMFDSASFVTDMAPVYRRWWHDFRDSQTPDGAVGSVAPLVWGGQENIWNDPWWGGMIVFTPWRLYQFHGDRRTLEEGYDAMRAYVDWLTRRADPDGLLRWAGASDWIEVGIDGWGPPKRTPTFLVSTCAWHLYADLLARAAALLGRTKESTDYANLARRIRDTFNAACLDPATGVYAGATNSQTALILPLQLGMVPEASRALVTRRLVENIRHWSNHLSTGFVGTPYLLEGLPELGLAELSHQICTQRDYAGWNTLISDGVMKETWRGGMAQMPSLGGSIGQWFYRTLAGIRSGAPGFREIVIRPAVVGDLTWVKAWHECPYGRIESAWRREGDRLVMDVLIPANTTAVVQVPGETGPGRKAGPGRHRFSAPWPR